MYILDFQIFLYMVLKSLSVGRDRLPSVRPKTKQDEKSTKHKNFIENLKMSLGYNQNTNPFVVMCECFYDQFPSPPFIQCF